MEKTILQNHKPFEIKFERGTLTLFFHGDRKTPEEFPWLKWDRRGKCHRCHGYNYRDIITYFYRNKIKYHDLASKYQKIDLSIDKKMTPFAYQSEALDAWLPYKKGITVLPTGSGKTFTAALMMEKIKRSTLILAPTIDLILQWQAKLEEWFRRPIGLLGGGSSEIEDITVSTYDSARIYAESIGNRFCMLIFDECHHLPSPAYADMARAYIAPYRLGLTATPNSESERQVILNDVIGSITFCKEIQHLSGEFLAPYRLETIEVELSEDERLEYDKHRQVYMEFREKVYFQMGTRPSWERFVMYCYRSPEGRQAIRSFNIQKQIAVSAQRKMEVLSEILMKHKDARILIFTVDNKTAYIISSLFLLPLITHETKAKERKIILENFRGGKWPFLVSSRVLNEGVDVPEANIAVVISGTSTVRELVQRLGRIIRKQKGKTAILYEIITVGTGEIYTSQKRKNNESYQLS